MAGTQSIPFPGSGASSAEPAAEPVREGAWRAVAVLTLLYWFGTLDRQVAALLIPMIKADLSLTDLQISMIQGLAFGLFPALHATRPDLIASIRAGAGQIAGGHRSASRFRGGLVTAQIALSMALLGTAGLFIRSLSNLGRVDLGVHSERVATFALVPQLSGYDQRRAHALLERAEREIATLPGVTSVGASSVPVPVKVPSAAVTFATVTFPVLVIKKSYTIFCPTLLSVVVCAVLTSVRAGRACTATVAWAVFDVTVEPAESTPVALAVLEMTPASMSVWVTT